MKDSHYSSFVRREHAKEMCARIFGTLVAIALLFVWLSYSNGSGRPKRRKPTNIPSVPPSGLMADAKTYTLSATSSTPVNKAEQEMHDTQQVASETQEVNTHQGLDDQSQTADSKVTPSEPPRLPESPLPEPPQFLDPPRLPEIPMPEIPRMPDVPRTPEMY